MLESTDTPSSRDLPLAGLKVVVTRPREQALQLAQAIERLGGAPLLFPLLDISAVQDSQALRGQLARLAQTDFAIFISPNAVRYGVAAMHVAGGIPETLKIAAVGQGSAKALHALGIDDVIAPTEQFDSEGLLALPPMRDVSGRRVMIFRGDGGRELLRDTLTARGAIVEYVTCYLRSKPQQDIGVLLAGEPDAITVSSSEALGYLWQMPEDAGRKVLRTIPLFVPHPRIADLAREQGWSDVHETASGDDGTLSALITWAGRSSGHEPTGRDSAA